MATWINPNFLKSLEEETSADLEELARLIFNHVHSQHAALKEEDGVMVMRKIKPEEATKKQVADALRELADCVEYGVKIL